MTIPLSVKYEASDFRNLGTARRGGTFRLTVIEPSTGAEVAFHELTGEQAEVLYRLCDPHHAFAELQLKDWIGESDAVRQ